MGLAHTELFAQRRLPPVETPPAGIVSTVSFGRPQMGCPDGSYVSSFDSPAYVGCPTTDAWCTQSYYLPSLGRYGLPAPVVAGQESPHSLFQRCPPSRPSCYPPAVPPGANLPPVDEDWLHRPPSTPPCAELAPWDSGDFSPDPFYDHIPYDPCGELDVYGGKYQGPVQRPLVELGFPLYKTGPVPPSGTQFGITNPTQPKFYLYGDYRAAVAYNDVGIDKGVLAHRLNLDWDLWFTSTERIHMFTSPLQEGGAFQRFEFNNGDVDFVNELDFWDADTDTLYFEGDLGQIAGGFSGTYAPFDMPIAVGLIPLLFQNGVWMEDAIVGAAVTIPARNSPRFDWSNYDVTFFAGFDQVTSPAFGGGNTGANMFGATTFIETRGGYVEVGYAYLDESGGVGQSYHNLGVSYTRRYLNCFSNSVRVIANGGQNGPEATRTADGVLLLVENSLLTSMPYNVIPYVNLFLGIDNPQSAARAGAAGGVLRNTGILFESDALTGYPTLDATANDTYGAAIGVDLLGADFSQQLILETAFLQAFESPVGRNAPGDQVGIGLRYQIPISNAHIIRADAMHGWFENASDVTGARLEFRWKF